MCRSRELRRKMSIFNWLSWNIVLYGPGKLPRGEKPDTPGSGVRIAGVTGFRTCGKTGLVPLQMLDRTIFSQLETVWLGGERVRIVPLQGKQPAVKGNRNAPHLINQPQSDNWILPNRKSSYHWDY